MEKLTLAKWLECASVDHYPNLLCQDMEKKLAVWFESKPDAREVFRCGGSVYKQKESEVK
jgi:hypothetical protein